MHLPQSCTQLTRLQHSIHSTPEVRNASARTDASPREEDHMLPFPNPLRHLIHLPTQLSRRVGELFLLLFIPDIVLPSGGSGVRLSPGMTGPSRTTVSVGFSFPFISPNFSSNTAVPSNRGLAFSGSSVGLSAPVFAGICPLWLNIPVQESWNLEHEFRM